MTEIREPWWAAEDGDTRAERVLGTCDYLYGSQRGRYDLALANVSLYEGRRLGKLAPHSYYTAQPLQTIQYDDLTLNVARMLVNTARSQVAAKQKPVSQFTTNGADWDVKQRAHMLEELCVAVKLQRQGPFLADFWAVGLEAFTNQAVCDAMAIKFWFDTAEMQCRMMAVPPWQLLMDPAETVNGEPQNLFHVYPYSRDKLAYETDDRDLRARILDSPTISESGDKYDWLYGMGDADSARMLLVREAWRLRHSIDKPGAHSQVIASDRGALDILSQDKKPKPWKRNFFPIEMTCWEKWMIGVYGTSIVDVVRSICEQVNAAVQRRAENETLNSNVYCDYEKGSVQEELLASNVQGIRIPRVPGSQPINWKVPESTAQGSIAWVRELIAWAHDFTGISEQSATAQKQPGIESKVAIVEVENIQSDRLGVQIANYERIMSVGADRQIVALFREAAEEMGSDKLMARYPGGQFFEEINWADAALDENQFQIQPKAVSGLSITPAAKKDVLADLLDRGLISGDEYKAGIQYSDVAGALEHGNAIDTFTDKAVRSWLRVKEEDVNDKSKFRYRGPLPMMYGLGAQIRALTLVGDRYLREEMDGAPPWRLDYFTRFIDDTSVQIAKLQARQAAMQGQSPGAVQQLAQVQGPGAQQQQPPAPASPPQAA